MEETEVSQIREDWGDGSKCASHSPQLWQHHCSKRLVMPNMLSP